MESLTPLYMLRRNITLAEKEIRELESQGKKVECLKATLLKHKLEFADRVSGLEVR